MELHVYEKEHIELIRKSAPECMVLLKNDGSFPIQEAGNVALYGSGARRTIKGGTGSGDVNVRHFTTIEEGLENAGFTVTTKEWLDSYEVIYRDSRKQFVQNIKAEAKAKGIPAVLLGMGAVMPEPEYELPLKSGGDLAIYVLSRISGEGSDRKVIKGDFLLTDTEVRDILALQKSHKRFLLVLNVGGVVDLTPLQEVKNILLLSQVGISIGDSFADVLLGKSYPSGKLTTTWAAYDDYCKEGSFGEQDDTRYNEGIYVGYRYFDTVGKTPMYPFGYGLGYTSFAINKKKMVVEDSRVIVSAIVKNTGVYAGKETLQVYVSVPNGDLDQPYQVLAGFEKTKELSPGESTMVNVEFAMEQLASFYTKKCAALLEAGKYIIRVGNSSRNTKICGVICIQQEIAVEKLSHVGSTPDFEDWKPLNVELIQNEEACQAEEFVLDAKNFAKQKKRIAAEPEKEEKQLIAELSDEELAYLCLGGFRDEGSKSVIGTAGMAVAGAAGETTQRLEERGIPRLVMADGPAGLRISPQYGIDEDGMYIIGEAVPSAMLEFIDEAFLNAFGKKESGEKKERHGKEYEQYCTAIPIGTALAQSWNLKLCEACGDMVGDEMERFGIHLWLAPALNIHRNVLCGRNFEYYSEDPLISGKIASAITKGVQKHPGCGVTIKHFVANNQETNRFHSNSIMSERTLRDIYLKGFEIAVKEAKPHALMTSYNLLNGEHTSQRRDLNIAVLREEWGYEGLIMSDWVTPGLVPGVKFKYPYACASGSIKAGNDIMMPGTRLDHQNLMEALEDPEHEYHITRAHLEMCAENVIKVARKLGGAKDAGKRPI